MIFDTQLILSQFVESYHESKPQLIWQFVIKRHKPMEIGRSRAEAKSALRFVRLGCRGRDWGFWGLLSN
jgi:hypothetical protein